MKKALLLFSVLATLCTANDVFCEEIVVATGHTFIKKVFEPIRGAFRDKTGIEIRIIYGEPASFLAALENGSAELAGASMPLEEWLETARKANVPVKSLSEYTSYSPATERTLIVVNAGNKVTGLTKAQLKGIFTGSIKNWKEVGGDDAPILVVWPSVNAGAQVMFKTRIMDNEPLTKTVFDVQTIGDTPDAVASTPEAIGLVTEISAGKGLKEIAPSIDRPLYLLYKGTPSPNLKKFLDFIKGEGKQYLK